METTVPQPASEEQYPPDIETMRATARRLLAENAGPLTAAELETHLLALRGHLAVIVPQVGRIAAQWGDEWDMPRVLARVAVAETRRKMSLKPGPGLSSRTAYARRLSRCLGAMLDHYETLIPERA